MKAIEVEVVYARNANEQYSMMLKLPSDATVEQAIKQSGVLEKYPEINLEISKVGIFSQRVDLVKPLKNGDRIEIYRPLIIDPKQKRRLRAKSKTLK